MRVLRSASVVLALVTLAVGCVARSSQQADPKPGRYGKGLLEKVEGQQAERDDGTRPQSGAAEQSARADGAPGSATGAQAQRPTGDALINDDAKIGYSAYFYLNKKFPKLIVEVDAVEGFAPAPGALSTLRSRLGGVADKPGGIQLLPVETIPGGRAPWTEADLLDVEQRYRAHRSTTDAIVLYVLYVDGAFAEATDAIGVAFKASAFAVFAQKIRSEAATPLVPPDAIEEAVVVHEMGHLLSLVNIGYTSPRSHEDPDNRGHSNNPASVMYWAMDNVGVANLLGGRTTPPTTFDADDLADLRDVRAGKLP